MAELKIPNEWVKVNISDIADVDLGKTPRKSDYLSAGDFKVVKFRDVDYSGIDWSKNKDGFVGKDSVSGLRELKLHDVLITASAHSSEHIGKKICFVSKLPKNYKKIYFCGELLGISAKEGFLSPKFCFYYFLSHAGYKEIQSYVKGVHLTSGQARNMSIPFTTEREQDRIIEIVEELLSDLDNAIEILKKTQGQVKVYRHVVLQDAFNGKLTEKWRQKNNATTGHELLKKIILFREQSFTGSEQARNKLRSKYKELTKDEVDSLPSIPKNWAWSYLDYIGNWSGGGTPSKAEARFWNSGEILWVSPKDMKTMYITDSEDKISKDAILESSAKEIKPGSVLFVVRSGILRRILPVAINSQMVTINQDLQALSPIFLKPEYIYWYVFHKEYDIRHKCAKDGTTVESIEAALLKFYKIPICSLEEQKHVLSEIESRLSVCEKIEQLLIENLHRAETLRQSILRQAFEGRLTEQWRSKHKDLISGENSAEALLKKIKAQKDNRLSRKEKKND